MARRLLRQTNTERREGTHGRPQRKKRKNKECDVNLGNTSVLATTPAPHHSESKKSCKPCARIIGKEPCKDFVRTVSESTSDKGASAKDSGGSTCCEHQKHRIQCKDCGGSRSQDSRKAKQ